MPLLSSVFLFVVWIVFGVLFTKADVSRVREGRSKIAVGLVYFLVFCEAAAGGLLVLSVLATTAIAMAVLPLFSAWAVRTNCRTFFLAGLATPAWLLWQIIGVTGPSGLYDTLRFGSCDQAFNSGALCKPGWTTFLSFALLMVQFAALVLIPGLLYLFSQTRPATPAKDAAAEAEKAPLLLP